MWVFPKACGFMDTNKPCPRFSGMFIDPALRGMFEYARLGNRATRFCQVKSKE